MKTFTYILLSALAITFSTAVYAQRTRNLEFDEVYPMQGKSYCNRLRVIDARTSKDRIGQLKTGAFNRSADLVTLVPVDKVLTNYYKSMLAGAQVHDSGELIMVLHQINIEDRVAGREIATFFLDADFFFARGDKYYYQCTVDTLYELKAGFDVTEKILKGSVYKIANILSGVSGSLKQYDDSSFTAFEIVNKRPKERLQYEAYKVAGKLKRGIYYTIEQFLNNSPVDTPILVKEVPASVKDEYTSLYYPKSRRNKEPRLISTKDVFAVSDGKRLLCSHNRGFTEMIYKDGDFYATQLYTGITGSKDATSASDIFGFVPATIISATEGEDIKGITITIPYYSKLLPAEKRFLPLRPLR